jgi:hypothetical protein
MQDTVATDFRFHHNAIHGHPSLISFPASSVNRFSPIVHLSIGNCVQGDDAMNLGHERFVRKFALRMRTGLLTDAFRDDLTHERRNVLAGFGHALTQEIFNISSQIEL